MSTIIGIIVAAALVFYALKQTKKQKGIANTKLPLLLPLIQGQVQNGQVLGSYQGLPARGLVFTRRIDDDNDATLWSTQLQLGTADTWELYYRGTGMLGMGKKELQIRTKDQALKARLESAGLLQYMAQVPLVMECKADLSCGRGWLCFNVSIANVGEVPSPEVFQYYLQVLDGVVAIARSAQAAS